MNKVNKAGIILYVNKYKKCLSFYKDILELEVLFDTIDLTCFNFFGSYLMIEKEDRNEYLISKEEKKNYSCLRLNIQNVKEVSDKLKNKNIEVDYQEHDWGIVAKFKDPDGNLIAFKDSEKFDKQIEEYILKNKIN
ncbi:MAG: glyoxalase [Flavobacterium sp.]|nr:MAG: glyoxalase [Flavobacterium sp.]